MEVMYTLTTPDGVTYEIADKYAREILKTLSTGVTFTTDETLTLDPQTGVLSVNTANVVQEGNALPVTSAAVHNATRNIIVCIPQNLTPEQQAQARENIGAQAFANIRTSEVDLRASKWVGSENIFSQVVFIDGVTENTQVDLTPSIEQLAAFYDKDLALVAENEEGVVTVYAIGQKPLNDYVIQVTLTEVSG